MPGRQSGSFEMAPIRPVFRVLSGLLALAMAGALLLMALLIAQEPPATTDSWVWALLSVVTLAFAARYFGLFAFTGSPPTRAPGTPLRTCLDVAYGLSATFVFLTLLSVLGSSLLEKIWLATFVLIFVKAVRRYYERGAASARQRTTPVSGR